MIYMMKDYHDFKITYADRYRVSNKKKRKVDYTYECDDILTFDIEVTSMWLDKNTGKIIIYDKKHSEKYFNSCVSLSLCYIWQFSYNDEVYYGRDIIEFREILTKLQACDIHFIIYVHNLSYEFQFLQNISENWKIFARDVHKVMYCVAEEFSNIEFRCSYFLTRLSLPNWSKQLPVKKLNTLDYDAKLRTPKTVLTTKEMEYCEHDCLVVYEGIKEYRERYEHIERIPLTQTGEVRRILRERVCKNKSLQKHLVELIPDVFLYRQLKVTFAGGYTHANFTLANRVITCENCTGKHYDFASSYPYVMLSEKFPMTRFVDCLFDRDYEHYCYLLRIRIKKLDAITYNHYISTSKCFVTSVDVTDEKLDLVNGLVADNGRVISNLDKDGSRIKFDMFITEQDLTIIEETYDVEYDVIDCKKSRKQYLPIEIISYILELYKNKTELKDIDEQAALYTVSKQFVNSIFGMCVTDLVVDDVEFCNHTWLTHKKQFVNVSSELEDLMLKNHNRTFLYYAWGVWISAYARRNLWTCLLKGDDGADINEIIYCDTDSIFSRKDIDFSDYNNMCVQKLQAMCDYYNIDFNLTRPLDKHGVPHPIGYFCSEKDWSEFVTLGAKRYCVRESDAKLHLTVSGINKSAVSVLKDDITNFNEDLVFDRNHKDVHKKLLTYIDDMPSFTVNEGAYDEYHSDYRFGINMRNTSYSMSITDEYLTLLNAATVISHLECLS